MGIESQIPFGLDAVSGQLVDVGSVKQGNACGCICPSCNTPLVARHGDQKQWHFAHRSQMMHDKIQKKCEYSFYFSVRLMIRQLSNDGLKFRVPRLDCSLKAFSEHSYESADFSYTVTEESLLRLEEIQIGARFCGVAVDVLGLVKNVPFVVFITYKDRRLPSELNNPSMTKCGVVELNVNAIQKLFKQEEKGKYKEFLRRYIEEEVDGKKWGYHPREQRLREAAIERRQSWLQQQGAAARASTSSRRLRALGETMVSRPVIEGNKPLERSIGKYICVICESTWEGTSRICNKCNTHLFTTERE